MKKKILFIILIILLSSNLLTYNFASNRQPPHFLEICPGQGDTALGGEEESGEAGSEGKLPGQLEEIQLFLRVFNLLQTRYLEKVPADVLLEGAIDGMVGALGDPWTMYLDESKLESLFIQTSGTFSGIGVEITVVEDRVTVIAPIKGGPGERAGLAPGDQILSVNGESLEGMSLVEAANKLRGEEGSRVQLEVRREGLGEVLDMEFTRENIVLHTVESQLLEGNMGYIQVSYFDDYTAYNFTRALEELEGKGINGLVLDLRDNPGGLLQAGIKVAEEIVPPGPVTHVVDGEGNVARTYYSYAPPREYPMVVLVNSLTASASEILAGALQDSGAAVLVGEQTYGKATVQNIERFPGNQGGMRYTVASYQTPEGRDISLKGLEPDIYQELPEIFYIYRYPFARELSKGSYGDDVLFLQEILEFLGYPRGDGGIFDLQTEEGLKQFQQKSGLDPGGVFNQQSATALKEEIDQVLPGHDLQLQKALEYLASQ